MLIQLASADIKLHFVHYRWHPSTSSTVVKVDSLTLAKETNGRIRIFNT
jgi:hypothetical protein